MAGIFVVLAPGAKQARGQTQNLLITSQEGNMLFSADGSQAVIGPDKLRVTGRAVEAAWHAAASVCFKKERIKNRQQKQLGVKAAERMHLCFKLFAFRFPRSSPTV